MDKTIGKLTIQNPIVNIRRGPTTGAGILHRARSGEVFRVLGTLQDPTGKTVESWAQIVFPENLTQSAFVCFRLASGPFLAQYVADAPDFASGDEYSRGWNDALSATRVSLNGLAR